MVTATRVKRPMRWLVLSVGLIWLSASPAGAQGLSFCEGGVRPAVGGGYNDVLRLFLEAGATCRWLQTGSLTVGLRYAEYRSSVQPFAALSYTWPLRAGLDLTLSVGARERLGDYEGDRLPELALRYALPGEARLQGWFQVLAGNLNVYGVQSGTVRTGLRAWLATPALPVGRLSVWAAADAGAYTYSGGGSHTFVTWSGNLRIPLAETTGLTFAYVQSDSGGSSPLRFDFVGSDRYWTAHLNGSAGPSTSWRLGVLVDSMSGRGVREYQVALGLGQSWLTVTYRTTDQRLLVGATVVSWP